MRVIHMARKPLSEGSVASNILEHGAGGLNIDATRIAGVWDNPKPRTAQDFRGGNFAGGNGQGNLDLLSRPDSGGRWPSNVVLQHQDGCRRDGIRKVKGTNATVSTGRALGLMNDDGWKPTPTTHPGFSDDKGMETVASWDCTPGCPVAALDGQSLSGGMHSAGEARQKQVKGGGSLFFGEHGDREMPRFGDKGGASRFYKQVGGKTECE